MNIERGNMAKKSKTSTVSTVIKLLISIVFDVIDFTVGRIPVFGTVFDFVAGFLAVLLWGRIGYLAFWEIVDISDQLDAEIPTLTLIGLISILSD